MPSAEIVFRLFNRAEGVLWIAIGVGFAVALWRGGGHGGLKAAACLLFVAFGVSDFVEIRTGGWYRPWWLLAWKATCVCGLALVLLLRQRRRNTARSGCPTIGE